MPQLLSILILDSFQLLNKCVGELMLLHGRGGKCLRDPLMYMRCDASRGRSSSEWMYMRLPSAARSQEKSAFGAAAGAVLRNQCGEQGQGDECTCGRFIAIGCISISSQVLLAGLACHLMITWRMLPPATRTDFQARARMCQFPSVHIRAWHIVRPHQVHMHTEVEARSPSHLE